MIALYIFFIVLIYSAVLFLSFFYIRMKLWNFFSEMLNNSNRRKRVKNQSLKEWFLYKNFWDIMPMYKKILYFSIFGLYFVFMISNILCEVFCGSVDMEKALVPLYAVINVIIVLII